MQEIPDTRGGRALRRILVVVLVGSIIGIADQIRTLFWIMLTGEGRNPVPVVIMLIGFILLCWTGYKAYRQNVVPPAWIVALIPVLTTIYLLWPAT
jgi:hypothetical protein